MQPRVPVWGNKASKPMTEKTCRGCRGGRNTPSITGECVGETNRVLECTQTHPPRNHHQKGPICLWVKEEVTESHREPSKRHCSLSDPSPTYSVTTSDMLPHLGEHLRLCPLQWDTCAETNKYGPNERTDQNSRKRAK